MGKTGSIILSLALSALLSGASALADGTSTSGTTGTGTGSSGATVSEGFDSTLPPQFNMAQTAGMAQVFQSCMGNMQMPVQQLGQGFTQMATGQSSTLGAAPMMSGMGFGMNAVCPGSDDAPDTGSLSCDMFSTGGVFDPGLLQQKLQSVNLALATAQCKLAKFDAVKSQLTCLSTQADVLSSEVSSLQNAYQQNIQRMQQDVSKIKSVEADRDSQIADIQEKLTGSRGGDNAPQTGRKGLLQLQQDTQNLVNTDMPKDIQTLKEGYDSLQQAQQALTEQIQTRTMALTEQCFSTRTYPQFRCAPNGPPVTAKAYVLCRYQQNQNLGNGGVVEQSQNVSAQASGNEQGLESLLDSMLADTPQSAKIPANPQDAQAQLDAAPTTILTAADIETQYGDQLSQYNGKGLNIHDFVVQQVGNCFQRSQYIVGNEQKVANSAIGIAQFNLKKQQGEFDNQGNTLLEKYSQQWAADMSGLTGQNLPLNLSACKNGAGNVKENCLNDIRTNMEGLLQGNSTNSTMTMNIVGPNDPNTAIKFTCQGLNGCITALQNTSSNLVTEKSRLEQFKSDYVLKANQSVDNFTKQMAGMMNTQSQQLSNKLKEINTALASLGVSNAINISPVQGETLEKDADGLPQPPKNALNLIGSQMNPPMLDVSGNNFSQAISGLGQGVQDEQKKQSQLNDAKNRLAALPSQCAATGVRAKMTQLQTDVNTLASANCGQIASFCHSHGDTLQNDISTVSSLSGVGIDPMVVSSLSSGMDVCTGSGATSTGPDPATANATNCNMASNRISLDISAIQSAQGSAGAAAGGATFH